MARQSGTSSCHWTKPGSRVQGRIPRIKCRGMGYSTARGIILLFLTYVEELLFAHRIDPPSKLPLTDF